MNKTLVITKEILKAAIADLNLPSPEATRCVVAKLAPAGEVVKDSGSFYLDTDKNSYLFEGGYKGRVAEDVRLVIDLFRQRNFDRLNQILPLTIPLQ